MENKETIKQILQEGSQDEITRIAIFDFDGTLVDTPLPEKGSPLYQQKTGKPWPHKGWWSKPESLDMDVFDMPVFPNVIADYNEEKTRPNTLVVMLTGRMPRLSSYVEKILVSKGLTFDKYLYSDGSNTLISKTTSLDELLQQYPNVTSIAMWEDRQEHINAFKAWGAAQDGIDFHITLVNSGHHD